MNICLKNVRISYAHLFEPEPIMGQGEPKYSVSILIPKSDKENVEKLNAVIKDAKESDKLKGAKKIDSPVHDGDTDKGDDPVYAGCYYLNAKANENHPPQIVDRHVNPIMDKNEVYSGCYCNIMVNTYAYSFNGHNGIGVGLGNVQKVKDGEHLGGGSSKPEDDFSDLGDEDFLN